MTPVYTISGAVFRAGQPSHTSISQNLSASGYRLPLEAEWEFAARGGNRTNGFTYAGSNDLNAVGWYWDNSGAESSFIRGYGQNISVRGTGASTQILITPDFWQQVVEPHKVGLFGTSDGENFTLTAITTDATTRFGLGSSFGPGDLFYGSRAGQPLREFTLSGNLVREFASGSIPLGISAIRVDVERDLLAGLNSNQLVLYDRGALTTGFNPPASTRTFPTANENVEATGEVVFGDGVVFALHTNNGVVAYDTVEKSEPPRSITLGEQPLWTLSPGDRDYLTFRPAGATIGGYSEHGLAFNPITNHLYIGHLSNDLGLQIAIVKAENGDHVGGVRT